MDAPHWNGDDFRDLDPDLDRAEEYDAWVAEHVPADPCGQCADITARMAETFPELQRMRGHVRGAHGKAYPHWWLVDADGGIVDPTRAQFINVEPIAYEPWDEGQREPTGKCLNCGGYCFDGGSVCSDVCADAAVREMGL